MTKQKRVLILGGTSDAAELAIRAAEMSEVEVISSLAGRTQRPLVASKNTRIGNFGGIAGLTNYLREQQIDLLIDATHPFAAQISFHAVAAATAATIPYLMVLRPAWERTSGDRWIEVTSHAAAAVVLPELAQRIFLTVGRQELAAYAHLQDRWFLMRMIDPPSNDSIPPGKVLLERGPFSLEEERSLLQHYDIGAIVSKNSGGDATYAKIIAARESGIPVVMVQRPAIPDGEHVADVESALLWLKERL
ncbi:cobalt-precorrin-6A reductase [Oscillatoria sp. FACHB-1407]|uniref:cobalt-precorrin-6A reductase n=1 Tax=Oscillatoria sp. FACHB-1407 TaxID=2692847 RepID=UPI0016844D98|nr:cobalt-precorrin-6A reductase [Oscillatoria sp. FACHB-1407]MBD2463732.1 cobalt-precorrin-6A reductase [Oscillatoria sp. FACHB-1407]